MIITKIIRLPVPLNREGEVHEKKDCSARSISSNLFYDILTGCHFTPVIPSEEEVLEYVDEICPSEDMTYTKKKSQSSDGSTLYEYTFSSEERDLKFTVEATSYLERGSGSTVPFTWSPSITDSYCNSIREYYFDEVMDVFERY